MPNVIAFTPRPRPPEPAAPAPLAGLALRAHLEDAAQVALDAADKIIAALDRIDGSDAPQGIETALEPRPADASAPLAQIVRLGDLRDFRTAIPHTRAAREETPAPARPEPATETVAARTVMDDAESFATGIARPRLREEAAAPESRATFAPLPWGGAGNIVAAAGCAILALVTRA